MFGGEAGSGRDLGLLTVVSGWALVIFIGGVLAGPVSRSVIGQYSLSGFIAMVLSVPAATLHLWLAPIGTESEAGRSLSQMFYYIGGLGSLTEGRKGWASFHSLYFIWLSAFSFLGFFVTAYLAKRAKPAPAKVVRNIHITIKDMKR